MKKEFDILMLPTNKANGLILESDQGRLHFDLGEDKFYNLPASRQHLYVITDQQPKNGDWVLCAGGDFYEPEPYLNAIVLRYTGDQLGIAKIIATSDPKLGNQDPRVKNEYSISLPPIQMPQLPEEYIHRYIKSFNEKNKLQKIALEVTPTGNIITGKSIANGGYEGDCPSCESYSYWKGFSVKECEKCAKLVVTKSNNVIVVELDKVEEVVFDLILTRELKNGDFFMWRSGMTGRVEIHQFHSDAGYGVKTFTEYNEKDGSSMLVNWSGVCGKIKAKQNI